MGRCGGCLGLWETLPDASCPSAAVVRVLGSRRLTGRCSRRGVRGRFKTAVGRGRRRRPGWLAWGRQSAARGPAGAGAALPPPGASEEAAAEDRSPARAGARVSGRAAQWGGGRRALCSGAGGVAGGVARSALARPAALHPGARRWLCVASAPTSRPSVTVCGEVARHRPQWAGPGHRSNRLL